MNLAILDPICQKRAMPKSWLVFCGILAASFARAEEATMAWHFATTPEERFRGYLDKPEVLAEPPAATEFAGHGDRLVDLSKHLRQVTGAGSGTWLVWNDTRHLLIAHGDARAVAYAGWESRGDVRNVAAIQLGWYQGIALGGTIPDNAEPLTRLEVICTAEPLSPGRPELEKRSASWKPDKPGVLAAVDCEIKPSFGEKDGHRVDAAFDLKWTESTGGEPLEWRFHADTRLDTLHSKPRVIAQAISPQGGTWTISASARALCVDGFPALESQWIEVGGKAVPRSQFTPARPMPKERVGEPGLFFRQYERVSKEMIVSLFDPEAHRESELPAADLIAKMSNAVMPAGASEEGMPLLDLKPLLLEAGVAVEEPWFAGYDYATGRALVGFPREEQFSLMKEIESPALIPASLMALTFRERKDGQAHPLRGAMMGVTVGQTGTLSCQLEQEARKSAAREKKKGKKDEKKETMDEEDDVFLVHCKFSGSPINPSVLSGFHGTEIGCEVEFAASATDPLILTNCRSTLVPGAETLIRNNEAAEKRTTQTFQAQEVPPL